VATDALRHLFHIIFIPLVFIPIVVGHCLWTIFAAYYFNCMSSFDVKYNDFSFIKFSETEDGQIIQKADSLNLALFLVLVFAVLWGLFFLYAAMEYIISAVVT